MNEIPDNNPIDTVPTETENQVKVDARGLKCPEPLMLVRNQMMDMQSGQVMKVYATDPSTSWDFPNFCKFIGHEMLHQTESESEYCYWIKKK